MVARTTGHCSRVATLEALAPSLRSEPVSSLRKPGKANAVDAQRSSLAEQRGASDRDHGTRDLAELAPNAPGVLVERIHS